MRDDVGAVRGLAALLAVVLTAALAVQFSLPIAAMFRHVSLNHNEGWGAYWSARALRGGALYTDAASPLTNNYPPLSFYIVGYAGQLIGDTIVAGRLLCLTALLACAALVGAIVSRLGGPRPWAILTGLAYLLIAATIGPRYIAANDPQWLAEAVQTAALLLLIPGLPAVPNRSRIVAAAGILLLAGLIKHNEIALPIAITLTMAVHDRQALAIWLGAAAVLLAVALAALYQLYGTAFFDQVLHHERVFTLRHVRSAGKSLLLLAPAALLVAFRWRSMWQHGPSDPRRTLLLLFGVLSVVLGVGQRLGEGVSQNAFFDAVIALSLLAGLALSGVGSQPGSVTTQLMMVLALIAPAAVKDFSKAPRRMRQVAELHHIEAAWARAIGFLAAQSGPVACERPALCYWAGKPDTVDFFNYGQKLRLTGDPWQLRSRIEQHQFGAMVVIRDKQFRRGNGRLPDDYNRLIAANYRVAQALPDDIYVLVPAA